jgi:hypothetical protein
MISIEWIQQNYVEMFQLVVAIVAAAEIVTRLTPTTKDDGFTKRAGEIIDKLMVWFPNLKKGSQK